MKKNKMYILAMYEVIIAFAATVILKLLNVNKIMFSKDYIFCTVAVSSILLLIMPILINMLIDSIVDYTDYMKKIKKDFRL